MENILPLSRRTDPAFLNAAVVFYRVVERVTSKRAAVQRVLLVSPRGVIYICHTDGRVTHTLHCLDVKWLRIDKPSTVVWADKTGHQTMISFRSDHVSNLPLCSPDFFAKVVLGFNPDLKVDSEEARAAPLELNAPANIWTQMLQGVRAIRRLDVDYITYINEAQSSGDGLASILGVGGAGNNAGGNENNNGGDGAGPDGDGDGEHGSGAGAGGKRRRKGGRRGGGGVFDNSDDDDIENTILGKSRTAPPLVIDDSVTPIQLSFAEKARAGAAAAASSTNSTKAAESDSAAKPSAPAGETAAAAPASSSAAAAGAPAAVSSAKDESFVLSPSSGNIVFGRVRVTRSSDPDVQATTPSGVKRIYSLEILQGKLIVVPDQHGGGNVPLDFLADVNLGDDGDDMVVLEVAEAAFPNSRDFSLVLAGSGNVISASWDPSAVPQPAGGGRGSASSNSAVAAALQKLTNRLIKALRELYPGVKIRTGSAATAELIHLSQSVSALSAKVKDLQRDAFKTPFQEQQAAALEALVSMICQQPLGSARDSGTSTPTVTL